jgi:hypothetical protein
MRNAQATARNTLGRLRSFAHELSITDVIEDEEEFFRFLLTAYADAITREVNKAITPQETGRLFDPFCKDWHIDDRKAEQTD